MKDDFQENIPEGSIHGPQRPPRNRITNLNGYSETRPAESPECARRTEETRAQAMNLLKKADTFALIILNKKDETTSDGCSLACISPGHAIGMIKSLEELLKRTKDTNKEGITTEFLEDFEK